MRIPLVEENVVDLFVDVNTTMMAADGLIVSRVVGVLTSPPAGLVDGTRVAVATGATGAFSGKGGKLAVYRVSGAYWDFYDAVLAVLDDKLYLSYNSGWIMK
jgi:hypothetical protein